MKWFVYGIVVWWGRRGWGEVGSSLVFLFERVEFVFFLGVFGA